MRSRGASHTANWLPDLNIEASGAAAAIADAVIVPMPGMVAMLGDDLRLKMLDLASKSSDLRRDSMHCRSRLCRHQILCFLNKFHQRA